MRTYEVDTVAEAVALARELADKGEYDWFRGQAVDWRVRASLVRLPPEKQADAVSELDRFDRWCQSQPALREQSETADQVIAIAQHYGMATTFVDFTTDPEVAGFFACDAEEATVRMQQAEVGSDRAAIILVNTRDVLEVTNEWAEALGDPNRVVRCLDLDVSNLWRLEAQRGVFMDLRYTDFEADYPFDRIRFPFDPEAATRRQREYYYPTRKSQLEQVIDHYFAEASQRRAQPEALRAMAAAGIGTPERPLFVSNQAQADAVRKILPDAHVVAGTRENPFFSEDSLEMSRFELAPGWSEALSDADWDRSVDEDYDVTRTDVSETLTFPAEADAPAGRDRVAEQVRKLIGKREDLRQLLVGWKLDAPGAAPDRAAAVEAAVTRVWDGMRRLPFSDRQIALAIGVTASFLLRCEVSGHGTDDMRSRGFASLIPEAEEWEFGLGTGSMNRGWASNPDLTAAMRSDVREIFVPEEARWSETVRGAAQVIRTPRFLFRFDAFAEIVATQLIPTQVATRARQVTFFSPTRYLIFGLP